MPARRFAHCGTHAAIDASPEPGFKGCGARKPSAFFTLLRPGSCGAKELGLKVVFGPQKTASFYARGYVALFGKLDLPLQTEYQNCVPAAGTDVRKAAACACERSKVRWVGFVVSGIR